MGVINVTPDSFADGGAHLNPDLAVEAALAFEADGADLIDVGGESPRPGVPALSAKAETNRVIPVLRGLIPR